MGQASRRIAQEMSRSRGIEFFTASPVNWPRRPGPLSCQPMRTCQRLARVGAAVTLHLCGILALSTTQARGQYVLEDVKDNNRYQQGQTIVPIGYFSEALRAAGGIAGQTDGLFQRQLQSYTFLIGSANGSYDLVFGFQNLQLKPLDRFFMDGQLTYARTNDDENNVRGNRFFAFENAGSNNSSRDDFIDGASNDLIGEFPIRYLLPIGDGRDRAIDYYKVHDGLLDSPATASGGYGWNPLESGRTFLQVSPFFEYMDIRPYDAQRHQWDTDGLRWSAIYDNRDYPITPQAGNRLNVTLSRDFGFGGSSNPWTTISGEYSQYISLGRSSIFRQQVLALDGWTSTCTTWKQIGSKGTARIFDAPPFYEGAQLGGAQRMRGFPEERFHGRAGMYGCAEFRLIPEWNPLGDIPILKPADISWMQFVLFGEVGRVADQWSFERLFSHMKGDAGVGVRIFTQDTVLRIDVAASSEGLQIWANLDQAF